MKVRRFGCVGRQNPVLVGAATRVKTSHNKNDTRETLMLRLTMALVATAFASASPLHAQGWPAGQPIKVVIPFTAGSATDVIARTVFEQVGSQIGQTFVIDNRVGAERHARRQCGREGRSGWLHAAGQLVVAHHHAVDLSEPALRHREGFRARSSRSPISPMCWWWRPRNTNR